MSNHARPSGLQTAMAGWQDRRAVLVLGIVTAAVTEVIAAVAQIVTGQSLFVTLFGPGSTSWFMDGNKLAWSMLTLALVAAAANIVVVGVGFVGHVLSTRFAARTSRLDTSPTD